MKRYFLMSAIFVLSFGCVVAALVSARQVDAESAVDARNAGCCEFREQFLELLSAPVEDQEEEMYETSAPVPVEVKPQAEVTRPLPVGEPKTTWTEAELRAVVRAEIAAAMPDIKDAVRAAVKEALAAQQPAAVSSGVTYSYSAGACAAPAMSAGACASDSASACASSASAMACASGASDSASGSGNYGPIRRFFRRLRGL